MELHYKGATMRIFRLAANVPLWALLAAACAIVRQSPEPIKPATVSPLGDTFFTGCAFLDENANGMVDSADALLNDMTFVVTLSGGAGFAGSTQESGCATVIVPASLGSDAWPVVARMKMPQPPAFTPIGEVTVTLSYPDTRAEFLFSQP